nr:ankyrin repeat domain-containing protein 9 [Paramormyrops kingsleyae]
MSTSRFGRLPAEDRGLHRRLLSFIYYQAIRDLHPVWKLEDMRTMETFYWDRQQRRRTYTPSEALLYAIVHDHQAYAQYLLSQYAEEALAMPSKYICSYPAAAPHLAMAVRYERKDILEIILRAVHKVPSLRSCLRRGDCFSLEDGKTPLHLACELLHLEMITLLLGNGASPQTEDGDGMTPVDLLLKKLRDAGSTAAGEKRLCLDNMILFMTKLRFNTKSSLEKDPAAWTKVLGEDRFNYLTGKSPGSLLLIAMQKVLQLLPSDRFPKSLQELAIPSSLKQLPVLHPVLPADFH